MGKWDNIRYFRRMEFVCPCCGKEDMDEDFLFRLDRLRETLARPLRVTSGWRCRKHNAAVGGKRNSAHLLGIACDIRVASSGKRFQIIDICKALEINRFGMGSNYIHLDTGNEETGHPPNQIWLYC